VGEDLLQGGALGGITVEHAAQEVLGRDREIEPVAFIGTHHITHPTFGQDGEGSIIWGGVEGVGSEHDVEANTKAPDIRSPRVEVAGRFADHNLGGLSYTSIDR